MTRNEEKSAERFWANKCPLPERYEISDRGAGVRVMVREIDARECVILSARAKCIKHAKQYARRKCSRKERAVLELVLKNQTNRKESIWELKKMIKRGDFTFTASGGLSKNTNGGQRNDN